MIRPTLAIAALLTAGSAAANPCGFDESGKIVVTDYEIGQTSVPETQRDRLAEFAETAKARFEICIFARVDATGSDAANERVAQARADGVRRFLAERGVKSDSMTVAKQEETTTFFGILPADRQSDRQVIVTHN
ncbi:MAG: OmpA family protein [Paracoccaceae bacterium]